MTLNITQVRSATNQEWDEIWNNCEYSTYFHSREWSEVWRDYSKGNLQPDAKLITFSDGQKSLLPLSSQKLYKGLVKNYLSSPAGTFGGWLSSNELSASHAQLLSQYLRDLDNIKWRLNPYDSLLSTVINLEKLEEDTTDSLDLNEGFENLYKKWTKGHTSAARKARKARKAGIIVKIATTLEEWQIYYSLYEDSLERWGNKKSSQYEWSLFNLIFKLQSSKVKLWLAMYQDCIISGALCFYSKTHVVYWHGAALSKYFNLRPVNLLMYEIIKHASEEKYHWFDFNPSGGHEGVKAFKQSFGTKELFCPVLIKNSPKKSILDYFKSLLSN